MNKRWIIGGASAVIAIAVAIVAGVMASAFLVGRGSESVRQDLALASNSKVDKSRLRAIGLTSDQRLVSFRVNDPDDADVIGRVSGLQGDDKLVGIDFRVQDYKLYGVGNAGGVYTVSTRDGMATKVSQLTVALSGNRFGVDFNPAADRLRIVSDDGQNLRHNVNAGGTTVEDTALTLPPATARVSGISGAAYTNNDLNADTATTLYDLDTNLDQVAIQAPANSGQLSPIGKLGVDAASDAGFDIYSSIRSGRATDAVGFASLSVGGRWALYEVSLITGRFDKRGSFDRDMRVTDIALPLNQR
jgi:hypothetical protein